MDVKGEGGKQKVFKFVVEEKSFPKGDGGTILVLKDISFELQDGEFISVIGPSGCGKTTLLRIIAGFDSEFSGKLLISEDGAGNRKGAIQGESPRSDRNTKNGSTLLPFYPLGRVGYIPQQFSLFPWKIVENNIRFALKAKKVPKERQDEIVEDLLQLVGLSEFRKFYPKQISGGMQQKVAICRALASEPLSNLIVMDEPFSALDAQTRNKIQSDLLDIWKKRNLTILFVTHNIDEAIYLSQKIIVLGGSPATDA